ncbi:hypothetical protein Tco_0138342 [Tanacetum coccineum]
MLTALTMFNIASTNEVNAVSGKTSINFHLIQICLLWKMLAYFTSQEMMKMICRADMNNLIQQSKENPKRSSHQHHRQKFKTKVRENDRTEPLLSLRRRDVQKHALIEEVVIKLQAEFDEEERLAREKDEANVVLTKEWDDIQAKIKADQN